MVNMEISELKELVAVDGEKVDRLESEMDKAHELIRIANEKIGVLETKEPEEPDFDADDFESRLSDVESEVEDRMHKDDGIDEDRCYEIAREIVDENPNNYIEESQVDDKFDEFADETPTKDEFNKLKAEVKELKEKLNNIVKLNKLRVNPTKKT